MLTRLPQLETDAYRVHPNFSPSEFKLYETRLKDFHNQKILGIYPLPGTEKPKKNIEIGNMVDTQLTRNSDFHNIYTAMESEKVGDGKIKSVTDRVMDLILEDDELYRQQAAIMGKEHKTEIHNLANYDGYLIQAIEEIGYYGNWTMQARIKSIVDKGSEYFDQLKGNLGKIVQPFKWFNLAQMAYDRCKADKYLGQIVKLSDGSLTLDYLTVLRQHEMIANIRVVDDLDPFSLKGRADLIIINHKNKTIQPLDFKTCKYMSYFPFNALYGRYDIQGDIYLLLIIHTILPQYPGYELKPFKFVAIPVEEERQPEVKHLLPDNYLTARFGYKPEGGKSIRGWIEIYQDIRWQQNQNTWDHYPAFYTAGGIDEVNVWKLPPIPKDPEENGEEEDLF